MGRMSAGCSCLAWCVLHFGLQYSEHAAKAFQEIWKERVDFLVVIICTHFYYISLTLLCENFRKCQDVTRGVRKTEIWFRYKKSEPSKNLTQMVFPTETACNPQFKLKVTKMTLLVGMCGIEILFWFGY